MKHQHQRTENDPRQRDAFTRDHTPGRGEISKLRLLWRIALFFAIFAMTPSGTGKAHAALKTKAKTPTQTVGFERLFTVGIGVQGGYFHAGGSQQPDDSSRATFGVQLHMRMLRIFGFSFMYDFTDAAAIIGKAHLPYPSMRLTGHLYLAQLGPVHLNILAGVGFNFGEQNNGHALSAYILGMEACFQLHPRLVITAGFHFVLPSYEQVSHTPASTPAPQPGSVDAQDPPTQTQDTAEVLNKIFDFRNVNIGLSARFFL